MIDQKIHAFMKVYILGKFQCISQINSSFDDALLFYFDTTLRYFLVHIFHFFCVINEMLSFQKSIMNPYSSWNSIKKFMMIPIKSMTTWIIKKLTMLILNMALNFTFVCNPKKLHLWYSKLSTYSCFHPIFTKSHPLFDHVSHIIFDNKTLNFITP